MRKLKEILEIIQLLCWNATEDDIEDKVQEWLKDYPHLRRPATIDLLRQAIKTWFRIVRLEERLKQAKTPKEEDALLDRIRQTQRMWLSMLGNLGISFTRQQYKSAKRRVQPPIERLKMLKKKGKKK